MDCEMLRSRLDAYMDGELPEEEIRALEDHARECEDCRRELAAAKLMRDVLHDMDEGIAVPLEAQAAWRGAVRAEARRRGMRRWTRVACAAAAALVLVVGGSWALKRAPEPAQGQPELAVQVAEDGVIARDGDMGTAAPASQEACAAWKKIAAEDKAAAVQTLEDLSAEYSGSCRTEGDDLLRIELPCAYLEDFLNAASRLGTELDSKMGDTTVETAVVYIQLLQQ